MPSKKHRKPTVTYGRTTRNRIQRGFPVHEDVFDEHSSKTVIKVKDNSARNSQDSSVTLAKENPATKRFEEDPFADPEVDELSASLTAQPIALKKKNPDSFSIVIPTKRALLADKSTNHPPNSRHSYYTIGDEVPGIPAEVILLESSSSVKEGISLKKAKGDRTILAPTTPTSKTGAVPPPPPPPRGRNVPRTLVGEKSVPVSSPSKSRKSLKQKPSHKTRIISVGDEDIVVEQYTRDVIESQTNLKKKPYYKTRSISMDDEDMVVQYDGDVSNTSTDQPESVKSSESTSSRTSTWVQEVKRGMASGAKRLMKFSPSRAVGGGKYVELDDAQPDRRAYTNGKERPKVVKKSKHGHSEDNPAVPIVEPLDLPEHGSFDLNYPRKILGEGKWNTNTDQLKQPVPKVPKSRVGLGLDFTGGRRSLTNYQRPDSAGQFTHSDEDELSSPDRRFRIFYPRNSTSGAPHLPTVMENVEMPDSSPVAASTPRHGLNFDENFQQDGQANEMKIDEQETMEKYQKEKRRADLPDGELYADDSSALATPKPMKKSTFNKRTERDTTTSNTSKRVVKKRATNDLRSFTKENFTPAPTHKSAKASKMGKAKVAGGGGSNRAAVSRLIIRESSDAVQSNNSEKMDIDEMDELQMDMPGIHVI